MSKQDSSYGDPPPYSAKPPPPQAGELPPGYQPYAGPERPLSSQYGQPNYGATAILVQPPTHTVITFSSAEICSVCLHGHVEDDYTCLGIFCAIFFFPLGIIACLLLKNRRCNVCGAYSV